MKRLISKQQLSTEIVEWNGDTDISYTDFPSMMHIRGIFDNNNRVYISKTLQIHDDIAKLAGIANYGRLYITPDTMTISIEWPVNGMEIYNQITKNNTEFEDGWLIKMKSTVEKLIKKSIEDLQSKFPEWSVEKVI